MILIDTCVLSEAFRKPSRGTDKLVAKRVDVLQQMILDDWPLGIPGIVYQEFLTGLRSERGFQKAKDALEGFAVVLADEDDHELAARIRFMCLRKGVSAAGIDCLIASIAINRNYRLMTFDKDFNSIAKVCHLKLFDF